MAGTTYHASLSTHDNYLYFIIARPLANMLCKSTQSALSLIGEPPTMPRAKVLLNPERWLRPSKPGAQLNTWAGIFSQVGRRVVEPSFWRVRRRVLRALDLPKLDGIRGAFWAVTMVKNEVDIIEHTIRHLISQGVDHILIADNGSTDGTLELLRGISRELPVHVGIDHEVGYYQDHKMTALAAFARKHGAQWVIPFDADEFWFARNSSLRDFLLTLDASVVTARMYNVFPSHDKPELDGIKGPLELDTSSPIQEKVAIRPHPLLWIGFGNHSAVRPGYQREGLRIVHVPWRSREQFARKVRQGSNALRLTGFTGGVGSHWTRADAKDDAGLSALWDSLLDRTVPEYLGWCPHGPFVRCDPSDWRSWDPDNVVGEGTARHKSWSDHIPETIQ